MFLYLSAWYSAVTFRSHTGERPAVNKVFGIEGVYQFMFFDKVGQIRHEA